MGRGSPPAGPASALPPTCEDTRHTPQPASYQPHRQNFRSRAGSGVSSVDLVVSRLSYHLVLFVSRVVSRVCRVSRSRLASVGTVSYNYGTSDSLSTDYCIRRRPRPCITHQSGSDSASRSACGERLEGNSTSARTCSVPLRGGSAPRRGIPLPRTLMTCMGAVTSERSSFTRWPSRWTRAVSKPSSAAWLGLGLGLGL